MQAWCRIVITNLEGKYIDQIGGNGGKFRDGSFEEAAFRRPQGVAYSAKEDALYVADTENHALRRVCTNFGDQLPNWPLSPIAACPG